MCTFSDGQKPLAIETLEGKFPYENYFCFNNSALYEQPELANNYTKFFWKLGMDNVKKFFDMILKNDYPPLSLKLTKQVMSKRNWLFESVKNSKKELIKDSKCSKNQGSYLKRLKSKKLLSRKIVFLKLNKM